MKLLCTVVEHLTKTITRLLTPDEVAAQKLAENGDDAGDFGMLMCVCGGGGGGIWFVLCRVVAAST